MVFMSSPRVCGGFPVLGRSSLLTLKTSMCVDDGWTDVLSFPDAMVYIPSFDGTSYLELRPLSYFLQSPGSSADLQAAVQNATVTLSVSVKTKETQGTILYSEYTQNM